MLAQVRELIEQQQAALAEKDFKITAFTHELAYLRRIRYGKASEVLASSGILPINNNPVENAIRPIAIGRKNWLFAGSLRADRRAAAIQTLFATAKINGLDPALWLTNTLEAMSTCPNSRIDSLLPFADNTPC